MRFKKAAAIMALVVGLVGDIITTFVGIEYFGAREINPVANLFMETLGNPGGFIFLSALVFLFVLGMSELIERWYDGKLGQWGSVAPIAMVGAMQLLVTVWNGTQILIAA